MSIIGTIMAIVMAVAAIVAFFWVGIFWAGVLAVGAVICGVLGSFSKRKR